MRAYFTPADDDRLLHVFATFFYTGTDPISIHKSGMNFFKAGIRNIKRTLYSIYSLFAYILLCISNIAHK